SVVIPCLNEAETIATCVTKSLESIDRLGLTGEVVVADNGSTDGSQQLAREAGARVIDEQRKGYGSAYLAGFAAVQGRFVVMGDGDDTYDFDDIHRFVGPLQDGADMVIGNRMENIQPGAMPWLHRYIGNPVLTGILNLFYRTGVDDAHCGMRSFRIDVLNKLKLRTPGMEFASEMVIRASKEQLDIVQIPIDYHPRVGESKLSSFRDGWRHLRFLLVHSPTWLFLVPGFALLGLGVVGMIFAGFDVSILGRTWRIHSMIAASMGAIIGSQIVQLGLAARAYGVYYLDEKPDGLFRWGRRYFRLETVLSIGAGMVLAGLAAGAVIFGNWANRGFGELSEERLVVLAGVLIVVGVQTLFSAFFLSLLGLRRHD
ncbi:MAG: glycosyltransferase family 2 protein, partial [Solirubrobacterales bacterium]